MATNHPSFDQPSNTDIKVWRYMDLAKFMSLMQLSKLYFARADRLGDPWEGASTPGTVDELRNALRAALVTLPEVNLEEVLEKTRRARKTATQQFYVNCWHVAEHESAAMWSLYSTSAESIAIQTTYEKISGAMPSDIKFGMVKYLDYDRDVMPDFNAYTSFMCKRRSFQHECEARAVWWQLGNSKDDKRLDLKNECDDFGVYVPIDISSIIQNVYINPLSPAWFADVVQRVVEDCGYQIPVLQSALASEPIY